MVVIGAKNFSGLLNDTVNFIGLTILSEVIVNGYSRYKINQSVGISIEADFCAPDV
jgi:hypothetical protein